MAKKLRPKSLNMLRALEILQDHGPIVPRTFGEHMWPTDPRWRVFGSGYSLGGQMVWHARNYLGTLRSKGLASTPNIRGNEFSITDDGCAFLDKPGKPKVKIIPVLARPTEGVGRDDPVDYVRPVARLKPASNELPKSLTPLMRQVLKALMEREPLAPHEVAEKLWPDENKSELFVRSYLSRLANQGLLTRRVGYGGEYSLTGAGRRALYDIHEVHELHDELSIAKLYKRGYRRCNNCSVWVKPKTENNNYAPVSSAFLRPNHDEDD